MKGYILASIFIACSSLVMSAQSVDSVDQSSKTSEQFQKELKEFVDKTQEYMLEQERLKNVIIPVDSTHQLSKDQKKLLKYAKNLGKARKNKIKLPIEVNRLLGDTISYECYQSEMIVENGLFLTNPDFVAELIVPMQFVNDKGTLRSDLCLVLDKEGNYYRFVQTYFGLANDSIEKRLLFESNIIGLLFGSKLLENNTIIAEYKIKENAIDIIEFPKSKGIDYLRRISTRRTPKIILKSTERSEDVLNRGVWRHPITLPSGYIEPEYVDKNWR